MIGEETVELAGIATRVLSVDGRGPTFVLVHGFGDSADTWRRVLRRLGEAGSRAVAIDMPSHGRAEEVDPDRPLVDQLVGFLAAAATRYGEGPVIAVGNSLGGTSVLLLAERHPELLCGVVPIGPAAFEHPAWFAALGRRRMAAASPRRTGGGGGRPRVMPPPAVMAPVVGTVLRAVAFGRPWRAPRGWVAEMTRVTPERRRALFRFARRLPEEIVRAPHGPYDLAALRTPVLLIWGDRDRLALPSSAQRLIDEVPGLRHVPLPGIGHLPQLEAPGRTTKLLLEFARSIAGERSGRS